MIYLNAEVVSGLGEDTFWTWFHREFPTSVFEEPTKLEDSDVVLRYSTLGFLPVVGKQVALCWELYPAMRERFGSSVWDDKIAAVRETARYATYRTVASDLTRAALPRAVRRRPATPSRRSPGLLRPSMAEPRPCWRAIPRSRRLVGSRLHHAVLYATPLRRRAWP